MPLSEPDELQLKLYEGLRDYSRHTFEFHLKRWDDSEAKVARFVTMLLALLGAGAFSVHRVVHDAMVVSTDWVVKIWLTSHTLFGFCALVSFSYYLWSFSYRDLKGPSSDENAMLPFFRDQKYVDGLVGLSKAYLTAGATAQQCCAAVQRAAHRGYLWFIAATVFGLLSAGCYAILYREIEHAKPAECTPATAPAPASTRPSSPAVPGTAAH
jgi:hypothetical protein